jgi:hypothetical protein
MDAAPDELADGVELAFEHADTTRARMARIAM